MEPVKVFFGTAKPIRYQELDERIGLDIDVDCRINGSVNVTEYPEEYPDEESMKAAVKEITIAALTEFLHNLQKKNPGRSFYSYRSRDEWLIKAVEEALADKGIRAEVEIGGFALDADSEEAIKVLRQELSRPLMYVDEMYKPKDWINTMAVYAGPTQMPPQMMMVYAGPAQMNGGNDASNGMNMILAQQQSYAKKEKDETKKQTGVYCLCPDCGYSTKPYKFCPECGGALKDVVLYRDCPACGNRVPAKDRFCRECGKALGEDESN